MNFRTGRLKAPRNSSPAPRLWQVEVRYDRVPRKPGAPQVRKIVRSILAKVDTSHVPNTITHLFLLLTGDNKIQILNREYRGKDKPTDVLSFPQLGESPDPFATSLGDLVLSVETTRRQAPRYGNTYGEEFLRLLIHGILHLLGHDHEGVPKAKAARMRRIERKLFAELRATV